MESRTPVRSPGPAPVLPPELFATRREAFYRRLAGAAAVIPAAPELLKSRDTEVLYRPSSDLYYLTGFTEPEAVAVLTPATEERRFTLFLRPRDAEREAWSGARIGLERAAELFGADAVFPISELSARLPELLAGAEAVHYPVGAVESLDRLLLEGIVRSRRGRQRTGTGLATLVDLETVTGPMRLVKDAAEIDRIRVAAGIAAAGHVAAMERARPGVGEWEIQATLEGVFRSLGASGPAFPSIVGAGANATVLHYVENASRVREGDLILVDAGAEWGMYCADITRTFPASGRFTPAQRDLYEVVLAAEEAAIAAAAPGASFSDLHHAALKVLARGMLDLRILPEGSVEEVIESGAYRRFYMHQTSHWLGLDVHDVGAYQESGEPVRLAAGMVLTVEPGIYIPPGSEGVPAELQGVGIRIEDDVLVTGGGREVLTRGVPVAADDVERLVSGE
jgi:Xaa-Pro aminopeptidase